jgi:taurine dioxygenase
VIVFDLDLRIVYLLTSREGGHVKIRPPVEGGIGAEFLEIDARAVTTEVAAVIKDQVYRHKLVVFRNQNLSKAEYIEFARALGRPQIYLQSNYHHPDHPEIFVSSNVPENGQKVGVSGTGRYWHSDYQFHPEPLPMTMLYPQVLPVSKRETYYIDMERVYQALPADLVLLVAGKQAIHEGKWRYKITANDIDRAVIDILAQVEQMVPRVTHPAVIEHPVTGRRALYISSGFSVGIEGLSDEDNRRVMSRLFAQIEHEGNVHVHRWTVGDILLWDNRTVIHRASDTPASEPSSSYRIGIYDGLPFYVTPASIIDREVVQCRS